MDGVRYLRQKLSTDGVVLCYSPGLITASSSVVIIRVDTKIRSWIFLEQFANPFQLVQSNLIDTAVIFLLNLKEEKIRRKRLLVVVAPHTLIQPRKDLPNGKKGPSQVKMYLTMSLMTARSVLLAGS